jgi:hypothetical protein
MIWNRRTRTKPAQEPVPEAEPVPAPAPADLRDAVVRAADRGWEALEHLVDQLSAVDATGDGELATSALSLLAAMPRVVVGLDQHVRRQAWYGCADSPAMTRVAARLAEGTAGPVGLALSSWHRDGRIRERAVALMVSVPCPQLMPFLVLRTADWVTQVRDRARAGLAVLLAGDRDTYLPAALDASSIVDARNRGGFVRAQVVAALLTAPQPLRQRLAASPGGPRRRLVFDVGLAQGWWSLDDLVLVAETEPDVRIRSRAAEAACREAVWTRRVPVLRRLAGNRRPDVRVVALTGLARAGHDAEIAGHLDDATALIRAVARDAARRVGIDASRHYREAVAADRPSPGSIAGLVETGTADDAVVRETATVMRQRPDVLPPGLAWQLLTDPYRVELRRAGYRLLQGGPTGAHLRASLIAARDADPKLAGRAVADATRLARDAAGRPYWRRKPVPIIEATAAQLTELADLARGAADRLGDDTTGRLLAWLGRSVAPPEA